VLQIRKCVARAHASGLPSLHTSFSKTHTRLRKRHLSRTQIIRQQHRHNGSLSWSPRWYEIRLLARLQEDRLHPSQHLSANLQVCWDQAYVFLGDTDDCRVGDIVDVVANGAVQKGLPYKVRRDGVCKCVWTMADFDLRSTMARLASST
jgi:hypothetical protein